MKKVKKNWYILIYKDANKAMRKANCSLEVSHEQITKEKDTLNSQYIYV